MPNAPFLAPERDPAFKIGRAKGGGTTYYSIPGFIADARSVVTPTNSTDYYSPFFVSTPLVVDQMALEVTVLSAGFNTRMGIYSADTDWQPLGGPLVDSGDISTTTTGIKTYTPGTPLYLPRGRYLTVQNHNDTGLVVTFRCAVGSLAGSFLNNNLGSSIFLAALKKARAYAAFPTPGAAWNAVDTTASFGTNATVFLRVSEP